MCDTVVREKLGDTYLFRCSECNEIVQTKRATRMTCGGECARRRKRRRELERAKRKDVAEANKVRFRDWYARHREVVIANVMARKAASSSLRTRSTSTSAK